MNWRKLRREPYISPRSVRIPLSMSGRLTSAVGRCTWILGFDCRVGGSWSRPQRQVENSKVMSLRRFVYEALTASAWADNSFSLLCPAQYMEIGFPYGSKRSNCHHIDKNWWDLLTNIVSTLHSPPHPKHTLRPLRPRLGEGKRRAVTSELS